MAAPVALSPTHSEAIDRLINQLDLAGLTSVEIAERLAAMEPPITMTDSAVRHRLAKLNRASKARRDSLVARELRVLRLAEQRIVQALTDTLAEADLPAAVNALRGVSESRRKLLGLDAPTRSRAELTGAGGKPLEINWRLVPDAVLDAFRAGQLGVEALQPYTMTGDDSL